MEFYKIKSPDDLKSGFRGILEPIVTDESLSFSSCKNKGSSVVVVPGAVFDRTFGRIGYGGGYYDKFFEKYSHITKIGVLFTEQLFEGIVPTDCHDIRMDMLADEKGVYINEQ